MAVKAAKEIANSGRPDIVSYRVSFGLHVNEI
jgi:hypothetical protein